MSENPVDIADNYDKRSFHERLGVLVLYDESIGLMFTSACGAMTWALLGNDALARKEDDHVKELNVKLCDQLCDQPPGRLVAAFHALAIELTPMVLAARDQVADKTSIGDSDA